MSKMIGTVLRDDEILKDGDLIYSSGKYVDRVSSWRNTSVIKHKGEYPNRCYTFTRLTQNDEFFMDWKKGEIK